MNHNNQNNDEEHQLHAPIPAHMQIIDQDLLDQFNAMNGVAAEVFDLGDFPLEDEEWPDFGFEGVVQQPPEEILPTTFWYGKRKDPPIESVIVDTTPTMLTYPMNMELNVKKKCIRPTKGRKPTIRVSLCRNKRFFKFEHWDSSELVLKRLAYLFEYDLPLQSSSVETNQAMDDIFRELARADVSWGFRTKHKIPRTCVSAIEDTIFSMRYRPHPALLDIMHDEMRHCMTSENDQHRCWFCHGTNDHIRTNVMITYMTCFLPASMFGNRIRFYNDTWIDTPSHIFKILSLFMSHNRQEYCSRICLAVSRQYLKRVKTNLSQLASLKMQEGISYIPARFNMIDLVIDAVYARPLNGSDERDDEWVSLIGRPEPCVDPLNEDEAGVPQVEIENHPQIFGLERTVQAVQNEMPAISHAVQEITEVGDTLNHALPILAGKSMHILDQIGEIIPDLRTTNGNVNTLTSSALTLVESLTQIVPALQNTIANAEKITESAPKDIKMTIIDLIAHLSSEYVTWPENVTIPQMAAVLYRLLSFAGYKASTLLKACIDLCTEVFSPRTRTQPSHGKSKGLELDNEPQSGKSLLDALLKFVKNIFKLTTNLELPGTKLKEWSNTMFHFSKLDRGFQGLLKIAKFVFEKLSDAFYWLRFKIMKDLPKQVTEKELNKWFAEVAWFESPEAIAKIPHDVHLQEKIVELTQFGLDHIGSINELHIRNPIVQQFDKARISSMKTFTEYYSVVNYTNEVYRVCPFHVVLHGDPGVGKSVVSSSIINDMETIMGKPALNRCMNRNASDQYWSGYTEQRWIRMDDAWQIKDGNLAESELADYFMMFSTVPFPLNMAEVNKKGKLFRSKGAISCTNNPFPNIPSCQNSEALYRRRNELIYVRKKKGSNPEARLKETKVNRNDHLLFMACDVRDSRQSANMKDVPEDDPRWMNYTELIEMLMRSYVRHMENQELLKNSAESSSQVFEDLVKVFPERAEKFEEMKKLYTETLVQYEKEKSNILKPLDDTVETEVPKEAAKEFALAVFYDGSEAKIQHVLEEAKKRDSYLKTMYSYYWKKMKEKSRIIMTLDTGKYLNTARAVSQNMNNRIKEVFDNTKGYWTLAASTILGTALGLSLYIFKSDIKVVGSKVIAKLRKYFKVEMEQSMEEKLTSKDRMLINAYFEEYLKELEYGINNYDDYELEVQGKDYKPKGVKLWKPTELLPLVTEKLTLINYTEGMEEKESKEAMNEIFRMITHEVFNFAQARYGGGSVMKNRHSQVKKVQTVFDNKPQMELDQNMEELLKEVSDSLCIVERITEAGTIIQTGGTLVRSNVLVLPGHYFGCLPHKGTFLVKQFATQREQEVHFSKDNVRQFDEIDLCVVDLGYISFVRKNGKGIRLWKKFLTTDEISKLRTTQAIFCSLDRAGKNAFNERTLARALELDRCIDKVNNSYLAFDEEPRILRYHQGYKYDAYTSVGSCGFPLVSASNRTVGRIMSLHTSGGTAAIGHTFPREELEKCLATIPYNVIQPNVDDFEFIPNELDFTDMRNVPQAATLFQGNFTHIGSLPKKSVPFQNTKTAIIPSLIAEEPQKFPAPLHGRDKRIMPERRTDRLMIQNAQAYGTDLRVFDLKRSQRVTEAMFERWKAADVYLHRSRTPGILTEYQALNGELDSEFNRPIVMDTSPGYPYVIEKRDEKITMPGKGYLFERIDHPDKTEYFVKRPELRMRIDKRLEAAKKGERINSIWYANLKDETLKPSKIENGKTRLFFAAPVDYAILVKMYFGDFRSMMCEARELLPGQVGANFEGTDTTKIVRRLLSKNRNGLVMDGDFAGFDQHQDAQTTMLILEQINRWYRQFDTWKEEDDVVRRVLISEVVDTLVLIDGELVIMHQSLPSGFQLTIDINNLINEFYHCYVWLVLAERYQIELCDPSYFYLCVCIICMGDDVLTSCVDGVEWWTMKNIALVFEEYGIQYTSADKSDVLGMAKPIEEVSFCKRGFRRHPNAPNIWMAPLEKMSLFNPTNWIHDKNLTKEDATVANAEGAVREAYYHGKREFEEVRRNLSTRLAKVGLDLKEVRDYEYYDEKFLRQF